MWQSERFFFQKIIFQSMLKKVNSPVKPFISSGIYESTKHKKNINL